jgi:hypothetical protein
MVYQQQVIDPYAVNSEVIDLCIVDPCWSHLIAGHALECVIVRDVQITLNIDQLEGSRQIMNQLYSLVEAATKKASQNIKGQESSSKGQVKGHQPQGRRRSSTTYYYSGGEEEKKPSTSASSDLSLFSPNWAGLSGLNLRRLPSNNEAKVNATSGMMSQEVKGSSTRSTTSTTVKHEKQEETLTSQDSSVSMVGGLTSTMMLIEGDLNDLGDSLGGGGCQDSGVDSSSIPRVSQTSKKVNDLNLYIYNN